MTKEQYPKKEIILYDTTQVKIHASLTACTSICKGIQAYTNNDYLLQLPHFFPISPDFQHCCHKLIVEAIDDSIGEKEANEISAFIEDLKCKDLFAKLFKKPRRRKNNDTNDSHLTTLFRCLQEFLIFTGQLQEAEKVSNCKIFRQLTDILSTHVNDADFSFTSLEDDEFFPINNEQVPAANVETFVEDFSSSDLSFI